MAAVTGHKRSDSQYFVESFTSSNTITLNVARITDNLGSFKKDDCVKRFVFTLDGLRFCVGLYPAGMTAQCHEQTGVTPIFVYVYGDITDDGRIIDLRMSCLGDPDESDDDDIGNDKEIWLAKFRFPLKEFDKKGKGMGANISSHSFKKTKKIQVSITLTNSLAYKKRVEPFQSQLDKMY